MGDKNTAALLLRSTKTLLDIQQERQREQGGTFNIFSILKPDERTHCRVIYELLRPDGSHAMGDAFLRAFFETVLQEDYPMKGGVGVYREYAVSEADAEMPDGRNYGYIDLLVMGQGFCYPIEVKDGAVDQWLQVKRYARFAARRARHNRVYYLTMDGHHPSVESTGGDETLNVKCLSFDRHIRRWLMECERTAKGIPVLAGTIQQYIRLLDKRTGKGDKFMDEIQTLVENSSGSFESALAIEQAVQAAKPKMMRHVFEDIETYIGNRLQKVPEFDTGADYTERVQKFYDQKGSSWPGLTYMVKKMNEATLAFRIEIGWYLYFGLISYDKSGAQIKKNTDAIKEAFSGPEWENITGEDFRKDWWLRWQYIMEGGTEPDEQRELNFRSCKGLYLKLYDREGYQAIMERIYKQLDIAIETIKQRE